MSKTRDRYRKLVRLRAKRARLDKRIKYLERKLAGATVKMCPRSLWRHW